VSIHLSQFPLCRHTKPAGRRCKSPALAASAFCYQHRKLRRMRPLTIPNVPARTTQPIAPFTDHQSVRNALNLVLNGLTTGRLDNRTAGQILYAIQVSTANLGNPPIESGP